MYVRTYACNSYLHMLVATNVVENQISAFVEYTIMVFNVILFV